jgi:hypothetical protein
MSIETWELMGYVVTVIGLPLAIAVFLFEQRKERENEEEEVYQLLSDSYQDFLKVAIENPDLRLFSDDATPSLDDQQKERQLIIFTMLVSLFERAYLLLYEDVMTPKQARRVQARSLTACWTRPPSNGNERAVKPAHDLRQRTSGMPAPTLACPIMLIWRSI